MLFYYSLQNSKEQIAGCIGMQFAVQYCIISRSIEENILTRKKMEDQEQRTLLFVK
jgi:hypothetical protein